MARPKLSPEDRRGEMLPPVRLTAAEYRLLTDAAKTRGSTLSEYVRETLLRSARRATR